MPIQNRGSHCHLSLPKMAPKMWCFIFLWRPNTAKICGLALALGDCQWGHVEPWRSTVRLPLAMTLPGAFRINHSSAPCKPWRAAESGGIFFTAAGGSPKDICGRDLVIWPRLFILRMNNRKTSDKTTGRKISPPLYSIHEIVKNIQLAHTRR